MSALRMTLADFIRDSVDALLADWERDLDPAPDPGPATDAKRTHLGAVLRAVADETRRVRAGSVLSAGRGQRQLDDSPASRLIGEYATLRALIVRQWHQRHPTPGGADLDEVVHFNEAMDRSLAELAATFAPNEQAPQALFLGVLNHELRTSLASIQLSAQVLLHRTPVGSSEHRAGQRIARSCEAVRLSLDALSDFTQLGLGKPLELDAQPDDFAVLCRQAVDDFAAEQPGRRVVLRSVGDLHGEWDDTRIRQAVAALVAHAARFSPSNTPVTVTASLRDDDHVQVAVHGEGAPMDAEALQVIFDRITRAAVEHSTYAGLGLGLFIVRKIVDAHRGRVEIDVADQRGTTLTIVLPRRC